MNFLQSGAQSRYKDGLLLDNGLQSNTTDNVYAMSMRGQCVTGGTHERPVRIAYQPDTSGTGAFVLADQGLPFYAPVAFQSSVGKPYATVTDDGKTTGNIRVAFRKYRKRDGQVGPLTDFFPGSAEDIIYATGDSTGGGSSTEFLVKTAQKRIGYQVRPVGETSGGGTITNQKQTFRRIKMALQRNIAASSGNIWAEVYTSGRLAPATTGVSITGGFPTLVGAPRTNVTANLTVASNSIFRDGDALLVTYTRSDGVKFGFVGRVQGIADVASTVIPVVGILAQPGPGEYLIDATAVPPINIDIYTDGLIYRRSPAPFEIKNVSQKQAVATVLPTPWTITDATNASPIVITTSAAHGYATGAKITVYDVAGNTAANGTWTIIVTSSTQFSLTNSVGNAAYTSGGEAVADTDIEFFFEDAVTLESPALTIPAVPLDTQIYLGSMNLGNNYYLVLRCDALASSAAEVKWRADKFKTSSLNVSGATNASPIVITTSGAHGYTSPQRVTVASVGGNTAANGTWDIAVISSTTFALVGSTGNGAYTSGGTVVTTGVPPPFIRSYRHISGAWALFSSASTQYSPVFSFIQDQAQAENPFIALSLNNQALNFPMYKAISGDPTATGAATTILAGKRYSIPVSSSAKMLVGQWIVVLDINDPGGTNEQILFGVIESITSATAIVVTVDSAPTTALENGDLIKEATLLRQMGRDALFEDYDAIQIFVQALSIQNDPLLATTVDIDQLDDVASVQFGEEIDSLLSNATAIPESNLAPGGFRTMVNCNDGINQRWAATGLPGFDPYTDFQAVYQAAVTDVSWSGSVWVLTVNGFYQKAEALVTAAFHNKLVVVYQTDGQSIATAGRIAISGSPTVTGAATDISDVDEDWYTFNVPVSSTAAFVVYQSLMIARTMPFLDTTKVEEIWWCEVEEIVSATVLRVRSTILPSELLASGVLANGDIIYETTLYPLGGTELFRATINIVANGPYGQFQLTSPKGSPESQFSGFVCESKLRAEIRENIFATVEKGSRKVLLKKKNPDSTYSSAYIADTWMLLHELQVDGIGAGAVYRVEPLPVVSGSPNLSRTYFPSDTLWLKVPWDGASGTGAFRLKPDSRTIWFGGARADTWESTSAVFLRLHVNAAEGIAALAYAKGNLIAITVRNQIFVIPTIKIVEPLTVRRAAGQSVEQQIGNLVPDNFEFSCLSPHVTHDLGGGIIFCGAEGRFRYNLVSVALLEANAMTQRVNELDPTSLRNVTWCLDTTHAFGPIIVAGGLAETDNYRSLQFRVEPVRDGNGTGTAALTTTTWCDIRLRNNVKLAYRPDLGTHFEISDMGDCDCMCVAQLTTLQQSPLIHANGQLSLMGPPARDGQNVLGRDIYTWQQPTVIGSPIFLREVSAEALDDYTLTLLEADVNLNKADCGWESVWAVGQFIAKIDEDGNCELAEIMARTTLSTMDGTPQVTFTLRPVDTWTVTADATYAIVFGPRQFSLTLDDIYPEVGKYAVQVESVKIHLRDNYTNAQAAIGFPWSFTVEVESADGEATLVSTANEIIPRGEYRELRYDIEPNQQEDSVFARVTINCLCAPPNSHLYLERLEVVVRDEEG